MPMVLLNESLMDGAEFAARYLNSATLGTALLAVLMFVFAYAVLFLAIAAFNRVMKRVAVKTATNLDDMVLDAVQQPLRIAAMVVSTYLALVVTVPEMRVFGRSLEDYLFMAMVVVAAFLLSRGVNAVIKWYGKEMSQGGRRGREFFPIVRRVIGVFLYLIAAAILLDHLGVQVAPLIAGLGIAGLAVALALQDTLANFFAGVYILADKPVRLGDYVRLDDGTEGSIEEVGWRNTKIKLPNGNLLVIPNSLLTKEKIINFSIPGAGMLVPINVKVAYDSDPEKVERVLLRVADEVVEKTPGTVKSYKPVIRLVNFGDYALEYVVTFQVEKFGDQGTVAHIMRKEILGAFKKEKIEIPFPVRTLYTKK